MKTVKNVINVVTAFTIVVGVIEATEANAQAPSDLRIRGRCVITEPGHEAVWFDIMLGEQVEPLKIVEIDSFGNEIVTNVKLFFRFDDTLSARFQTDLPAPLTGHSRVS